jgi:putative oxidoreductase
MLKLFKPSSVNTLVSTGLLLLRLVAGLAFMHHGYGKIQNPTGWMGENATIPGFFQALAAISEFGGGLAWILGLVTPLASFGIACTMVMAIRLHAFVLHDPFVAQGPGKGAWELAAVYLSVAILLLLAGPGRFSLDRLIFGERTPVGPEGSRLQDSDTPPSQTAAR